MAFIGVEREQANVDSTKTLANAIAWPVAFFVLNRWLAFYAYRIDIGVGWFVLAGVGVLAVALATVNSQTSLAARTNPADALIYE